jgi:hypothetical protein
MKNWGGQFTPELGGHFELESGAHFKLELGGQYHRNMHHCTGELKFCNSFSFDSFVGLPSNKPA